MARRESLIEWIENDETLDFGAKEHSRDVSSPEARSGLERKLSRTGFRVAAPPSARLTLRSLTAGRSGRNSLRPGLCCGPFFARSGSAAR